MLLTEDSSGFVIVHNSYDGREHSEPEHNCEQCEKCSHSHA